MAILTGVYVTFTYFIIKETKKTREQSLEPDIIVDIELVRSYFLNIKIANISASIAKDITIKSNPSLKIFEKPILFLSPGKEVSYCLGFVPQNKDMLYHFEITYQDINKKRYTKEYVIDIEPIIQQDAINSDIGFKEIADQLKNLDNLRDIKNSLSKIESTQKDIKSALEKIKR